MVLANRTGAVRHCLLREGWERSTQKLWAYGRFWPLVPWRQNFRHLGHTVSAPILLKTAQGICGYGFELQGTILQVYVSTLIGFESKNGVWDIPLNRTPSEKGDKAGPCPRNRSRAWYGCTFGGIP